MITHRFSHTSMLLAGAVGIATSLSPRAARADAASCSAAHTSGQRETNAGHLKSASDAFRACASDETCPQEIKNECMSRYQEVSALTPSLVFGVQSDSGDITQVKVWNGSQLLTDALDGRQIQIDPGKYQFRFVLPSGEELTSDVLVREGEKNRLVTVRAPSHAPAPAPAPLSSAPPAPVKKSKGVPAGFWIASGVGVAALGSFAAFGILGKKQQTSLAECSPRCDAERHDDYDRMRRSYLIADISLGAAAVSAGIAAIILAGSSGSESSAPRAARALTLVPVVTTQSAALVTTARF
ncbi:MAG: hypothetical protein QM756_34390 [Polyangiaceae bacterium]